MKLKTYLYRLLLVICGFLLSAFCSQLFAADIITATITITNTAGTTNGQTLVVNGATRTWTNSVVVPGAEVLTNSSIGGSASNLFTHLAITPFSALSLARSGTNGITLQTAPGGALTVTLSAGWGAVVLTTNTLTSAYVLRLPVTVESAAPRTNITSLIVSALNDSSQTNSIFESSTVAANLVGKTNDQTGITGNKTFTGVVVITNSAAIFYAGTVSNAMRISGTVSAVTNGVLWNSTISNATSISGIATLITNGLFKTNVFAYPTFTNGVNYGLPFRSPGSGTDSEQFGTSAQVTGDYSVALGNSAVVTGDASIAIGQTASSVGNNSVAIGSIASVVATNAVALGVNAQVNSVGGVAIGSGALVDVSQNNSVAIGISSTTTSSNQIRLGTSSQYVSIPGGLKVDGVISNAIFGSTNTFPAGSDISFGRYAVTSLANGNNAAVPVGTNVFIEVSGPSAAFTLNGINASPNRDGKLVVIVNQTGFDMTVAHQSGTDPAAANRIINMTGADRTTTGNGTATLIYSASASRWLLINFDP